MKMSFEEVCSAGSKIYLNCECLEIIGNVCASWVLEGIRE